MTEHAALSQADQTAQAAAGNILTAAINISSSGDNTVIAATSGKQIRLVKLVYACAGAVNVTLNQGTSGEGQTALSGAIPHGQYGGAAVDFDEIPMTLAASKSFVMNLSAAVSVAGFVMYWVE